MTKENERNGFRMVKDVVRKSNCFRYRQACGAFGVWTVKENGKDKEMTIDLEIGWTAAPPNVTPCNALGYCERERRGLKDGERLEVCRSVHAPQSLLTRAAYFGRSLRHSEVLATHEPCLLCLRMLIEAGVKKVVYLHPTPHAPEAEPLYQDYCKVIELEQFTEEG